MKNLQKRKHEIVMFLIVGIMILAFLIGVNLFEINSKTLGKTQKNSKVFEKHIAMINVNSSEEFWVSVYKSAKEEGEEKGIYVENFGDKLIEDFTTAELMEMAIAAKVDGIIVKPDESEALGEMIQKAEKEKIPVITLLEDVRNSGRLSFVSGNDYAMGEMYGNQIVEAVEEESSDTNEKIRVGVLVNSNDENSEPNLIYSAIRETTSAVKNKIELSAIMIDNSTQFQSEETVRDLLLSVEPPDLLVCLNTEDTISAYQSIIEYNRVGETSVIGYYTSKDTLEGIQEGIVISSVLIDAKKVGETAVAGMYQYWEEGYVNEYLTVSPVLITKENVNEYTNESK